MGTIVAALPGCGSSRQPEAYEGGGSSSPPRGAAVQPGVNDESPPGTTGRGGYAELYSAKRYEEAYAAAVTAAKSSYGREQERAQLIAGLSAHARDRDFEAEPCLKPLADSSDPSISSRATVALGLIAQRAGNHERAIDLLTRALPRLEGDQAARAWMYIGDSHAALRRSGDARDAYAKAESLAPKDGSLATLIAGRRSSPLTAGTSPTTGRKTVSSTGTSAGSGQFGAAGGKYTLQLGAFSSRQRAQSIADRAQETAARLGLGSPRLIDSMVRGRSVTLVQIGRFASPQSAESARRQLGSGAFVTMASD